MSASHLFERVPEDVRWICRKLAESGKRGWVVGGCVRDLLLGKDVADWDVATDAHPREVQHIFPKVIPTGIRHGTVTVLVHGVPYEVTTLRGEGAYTDGRRPDSVEFTDDITRDLARRDFTVNAIALDPHDGRLLDPFDGQKDLARRVLRAVGDPMLRFQEDGLRVLRAARFVATLELDLDPDTARAIAPNLPTFRKVSAERVRDEWMKTMKARAPSRAFEVMRETGLLAATCPELLEGWDMAQNKWHAFTVWGHAMACVDGCPGSAVLRLSALLHDIGKPRSRAWSDKTGDWTFYDHDRVGAELVEPVLARLRLSNDDKARVVRLVRHHLICYDAWSDAAVRRWMRRVGPDLLEDLYVLNAADVGAKGRDCSRDLEALAALRAHVAKVVAEGAALRTKDLAVDGRDLMRELGLAPGPILGEILSALLDDVVGDATLNVREALLSRARAYLAARGAKG